MKYLSILLLFIVGCNFNYREDRLVYSEVLNEEATVVDLVYTPGMHYSDLDIGFSTSGDFTFTPRSTRIRPKYAVVFECQHGKFIVQGEEGSNGHKQWKKLKQGQKVTVLYKEIYSDTYEGDKFIQRVIINMDFLDTKPL